MSQGIVAGIDVGGTFTDLLLFDAAAGTVRLAKIPTTPDNQAFGVLAALDATGVPLAGVDLIVHGTTTTTNAVLERRLARTGLITTAGFRDVLELGRRTRPKAYGMTGRFTPLIPRDLRLEVPERMDARGRVLTPLDEPATRVAVAVCSVSGCESLVIHFLHAYANPTHELPGRRDRRGDLAERLYHHGPRAPLREPRIRARRYCRRQRRSPAAARALRRRLAVRADRPRLRPRAPRRHRQRRHGVRRAGRQRGRQDRDVRPSLRRHGRRLHRPPRRHRRPHHLRHGRHLDRRRADPRRRAAVSNEIELEYAMPIHVPMVDVRTVGAGGGSIARVNAAGLLKVGPESAGAEPGPIAYGRGGTRPTISDANLLLGRLNPGRFADLATIRRVFAETLGNPLGLTPEAAAAAVIRIADTHMAGAIRMVSLSLGADPRDFTLFAFGGAGPLHAAALARELGIPRLLVPARPGITNALGCVVADLRHDFVRTVSRPLAALDITQVHRILAEQEAEGRALIAADPSQPAP